ncbi:MAG: hypothetical protein WCA01_13680 [Burkholderiales bacterium]
MLPAANIGKLGFRRWHERQLIEGHAWFVTGLLCAIAVAALLEALAFNDPLPQRLLTLAGAFAAGLVGCYAFSAYFRITARAQRLADCSTCKQCGVYGSYALTAASSDSMSVRCRNCGSQWTIA